MAFLARWLFNNKIWRKSVHRCMGGCARSRLFSESNYFQGLIEACHLHVNPWSALASWMCFPTFPYTYTLFHYLVDLFFILIIDYLANEQKEVSPAILCLFHEFLTVIRNLGCELTAVHPKIPNKFRILDLRGFFGIIRNDKMAFHPIFSNGFGNLG